jgi:hypothetical protein
MILPISFPRVYHSGPGFVFQASVGGRAVQYEIAEIDILGLVKSAVAAQEAAHKKVAA